MNKRGHIKKLGNSSLTQSLRELEKSSLDGLQFYLRADFPTQPTNLAQDTRIANALKKFASCKNAESTLDSANSQNLAKNNLARSANLCKSFCFVWLSPKVESPLLLNSNLPNKADSQNLIENQVKKSSSKFLLLFAFAKSRVPLNFIDSNLPNKVNSQNLQGGLPRSHSLARNDKFLDSSLRLRFAQNDKFGGKDAEFAQILV